MNPTTLSPVEQIGIPHSETTIGGTYDCEPTLNDQQVFEFCRKGYLALEGVVEDEVNHRMMDFVDEHPEHQPLELLTEDWFVDGVFKNPQAAGAVRSLLGKNFKLPQTLCNHRAQCPAPPQGWHRDGGSIYTPRLDYLQVFYYPQDTSKEAGPHRSHPRLPLRANQSQLHGPPAQCETLRTNHRTGRLYLHYRLFNMAPQGEEHHHRFP